MSVSPFKLFEPYSLKDKNSFFGRRKEIFAIYNLLQQTQLLLIYGASGTGKTSIIQAGLPTAFKLTEWFRIAVRKRDNINDSLRIELDKILDPKRKYGLPETIGLIYKKNWMPIYLVFDQFEELFTLGTEVEQKQFFENIQTILTSELHCKIIFSMREEYIGHLYDYEYIVPSLFEYRYRVEGMKDATVRTVIEQMCAVGNVDLAEGKTTATQILNQVKADNPKQAAHLPYLQVYLHYLFEKAKKISDKISFTPQVVSEIGALGNVLKLFIETQLESARLAFTKIGLPDDFAAHLLDEFATDEGTKQSRRASDLAQTLNTDVRKVAQALNYFSEAKLLRADENDVERYEPVHDVVAKQIYELRSAEDKEYKAFTRHLELAHEAWLRDGKPMQRLLPDLDLSKVAIYEARLKRQPNYKNKLVELINSSRTHVAEIQKQKRRQNNILRTITAAALMGLTIAVIFYFKADRATKVAEIAKEQANESLKKMVEAEKARKTIEVDKLLQQIEVDIKAGQYLFAQVKSDSAKKLDSTIIRIDYFRNLLPQNFKQ